MLTTTKTTDQQLKENISNDDGDDDSTCSELPKYVQSMIIDMLIHGHDFERHYDDDDDDDCGLFQFRYHQESEMMMMMGVNKPLEKQNQYITFKQLKCIALVSKWWMKVVIQITSKSIELVGPLKESYFSLSSNRSAVTTLKWKVFSRGLYHDGKPLPTYTEFDYTRLPRLLPNLHTLNIYGECLDNEAIKAIVQVINLFPHIQVNLEITIDSKDRAIKFDWHAKQIEWPIGNDHISFHKQPIVVVTNRDSLGGLDAQLVDCFHRMLDDLKPTYFNLVCPITHFDLESIFQHLKTVKHVSIAYDFVQVAHLKHIVNCNVFKNIETLRVGPITHLAVLVQTGVDAVSDWDELCYNLSTHSTLKKLSLSNPQGHGFGIGISVHDVIAVEPVPIENTVSSFTSIWKVNNSIELLALSNHPNTISPHFFSTLCHNQSITTLILTDGTLVEEYIPSFSQLLLTNQTISNNHLELTVELAMAFKKNKSIKILDIRGNHFKSNLLFDSLLESDSIQYLTVNEDLIIHFKYNQSFILGYMINKTTTTTTTTLSKYIQSIIIDYVIHDFKSRHYNSNCDDKEMFKHITSLQLSYLMINNRPKKQNNKFSTFKQLGSIALVSKWWMEVSRQIVSSSIKIVGPFKESYFSLSSSSSSSDTTVSYLKWKIKSKYYDERDAPNYTTDFDYTRLPLLLPKLRSIDIVAKKNSVDTKSIREIKQVIDAFPYIQVNLDIEMDENGWRLEWPADVINNLSLSLDGPTKLLDYMKPNNFKLLCKDRNVHFDYPSLFQHLSLVRHINIAYDYVELSYLKHIVNCDSFKYIQSLKVGIITCHLENELSNDGHPIQYKCRSCGVGGGNGDDNLQRTKDTVEDWNELCFNLSNHSNLKQLWLESCHGIHPMALIRNGREKKLVSGEIILESASLERVASSFASIWRENNKVELLSLSKLPNIISPLFFSTLCLNQSITTLILNNGTLVQEYIPLLCKLLMTTKTIKSLDISWNYFQPSSELVMAFKQNKSIKVLNIANNRFSTEIFDSLLESTTLQYLIIDGPLSQIYYQHLYFKPHSKSSIKCFVTGVIDLFKD
ncbi:hypothetical protein DFA_06419 [Cavenderia fasciculata]|uniref:Uncharacterized protein n=1 Tax=Cavenderia fasciculata TaxID=261658 RepID=F4PIY3_CACFS|nr:uncharacterized protein DFA_06419 [Cavenderia fasciculata]EGG24269.1 hypothetical protein DFA_06419 [Cavenderia fasciculata]|eukprot:XP_004362120.1 hypothetical protein DFA_06419 [Cavenderia fasciculata]